MHELRRPDAQISRSTTITCDETFSQLSRGILLKTAGAGSVTLSSRLHVHVVHLSTTSSKQQEETQRSPNSPVPQRILLDMGLLQASLTNWGCNGHGNKQ